MRRIICVILCFVFAISLVACNNTPDVNSSGTVDSSADVSNSAEDGAETTAEITKDKKTLVVYYSATGNTKAAAETIADTLGADVFEIIPVDPYTSNDLDWTNGNSRVSAEHNDESKRNVPLIKATPDNWEQYDTVYIGYPIWWGIAAWPVNGFIESNDFADKTVVPFCTSSSSDIGNSGELLEELAGAGNWLAGKRFSSNSPEKDIAEWVSEITK